MQEAETGPAPITEFAPAKVNLCLHVTGWRADGYHLLDSLVVFAGVGDTVRVAPGRGLSLACDGPFGALVPSGDDNLVLRAARVAGLADAKIALTKRLPPASGIGGGSADAAATLRAAARFLGQGAPALATLARLGADVPACHMGRALRLRGIGETLAPLPPAALPPFWLVLVNPGVELSTPAVFAALDARTNPPLPPDLPDRWPDAASLAAWLSTRTRNDLEPPARHLAPVLAQVEAAIEATDGCLLARMSGSGATCFGLYAAETSARAAAAILAAAHPGWWVAPAPVTGEAA